MIKKRAFLLVAILGLLLVPFLSATAEQAGPISFGFKLGANLTYLSGDDAENMDSKTTLCFGGFLTYSVNELFAIQSELLYVEKGAELYHNSYYDITMDYDLAYIEIPVLARFNMPAQNSDIKPNVFFGPVFSINTEAEAEIKVEGPVDLLGETYDYSESGTVDISDEVASIDIGLIFGVGIEIPAGNGAVIFDVRYNLGLQDVYDEGDIDLKNRVISFMVGYRF